MAPLPSQVMKAMIRAVGAYAPARVMTNAELSTIVDTTDEWIMEKTGVKRRHIAADDEATSDLAVRASKAALTRAGLPAEELDLVIVATSTPDFPSFPSTACIVQDRIGARNAGAMDIAAACTGFIYALDTASAFVKSRKARNVLVVGAEVMSRVLDWTDRATCVLFVDSAGAALVTANEGHGPSDIVYSLLRSDGSGDRALERTVGGSRYPLRHDETDRHETCVKMDGRRVYNFAVRVLVESIEKTLKDTELGLDDIAYVVPHQANHRIIAAAAQRSGIPLVKFYMNLEEYANTSAASIPLALNEMHEKHLLRRGDYLLFIGFGAGLTYGANLVRY
jgi:3-oxoacyl-[acyl-carrier-protein] synthase III